MLGIVRIVRNTNVLAEGLCRQILVSEVPPRMQGKVSAAAWL